MFLTFLQQLQMKLEMDGYETVEMNSHVVNSPFTVGSLLVEKDAWFASCRCLLQEGTARQEEAQHSMLHENCM